MSGYWLYKTEPETYSFATLAKDGKTCWNGVRNFQARNNLRLAKLDDLVLIYHSGKETAVVGVAKISRESYPDIDPDKKGDWVQVDVTVDQAFLNPVTLAQIKRTPALRDIALLKQSRLSVVPLTAIQFRTIVQMGIPKA